MRFVAEKTFWQDFDKLPLRQQKLAMQKFQIFRQNPFAISFKTHKIHNLSQKYKQTIYFAALEGDLRVIFFVQNDTLYSVSIGSHKIYR